MSNKGKSLKFGITIKKNDNGIPEVSMSAEVIMDNGFPNKIGTDIFLLSGNPDNSQRILKGRVGQNVAEIFMDIMT